MMFSERELDFLSSQTLGRLATLQADGTLQVNPVGFTYNIELDTFDIHGYRLSSSRKFRNVAENGRVAFVVDDVPSVDPWRVRCSRSAGTRRPSRRPGSSRTGSMTQSSGSIPNGSSASGSMFPTRRSLR